TVTESARAANAKSFERIILPPIVVLDGRNTKLRTDEASASVELADLGQELAARLAQTRAAVLEALQDHHVALAEEFLAQALGVRRAGIVAASAILLSVLRGGDRGRERGADRHHGNE